MRQQQRRRLHRRLRRGRRERTRPVEWSILRTLQRVQIGLRRSRQSGGDRWNQCLLGWRQWCSALRFRIKQNTEPERAEGQQYHWRGLQGWRALPQRLLEEPHPGLCHEHHDTIPRMELPAARQDCGGPQQSRLGHPIRRRQQPEHDSHRHADSVLLRYGRTRPFDFGRDESAGDYGQRFEPTVGRWSGRGQSDSHLRQFGRHALARWHLRHEGRHLLGNAGAA